LTPVLSQPNLFLWDVYDYWLSSQVLDLWHPVVNDSVLKHWYALEGCLIRLSLFNIFSSLLKLAVTKWVATLVFLNITVGEPSYVEWAAIAFIPLISLISI